MIDFARYEDFLKREWEKQEEADARFSQALKERDAILDSIRNTLMDKCTGQCYPGTAFLRQYIYRCWWFVSKVLKSEHPTVDLYQLMRGTTMSRVSEIKEDFRTKEDQEVYQVAFPEEGDIDPILREAEAADEFHRNLVRDED